MVGGSTNFPKSLEAILKKPGCQKSDMNEVYNPQFSGIAVCPSLHDLKMSAVWVPDTQVLEVDQGWEHLTCSLRVFCRPYTMKFRMLLQKKKLA
jgi:hypothetical protein